MRYLRVLAILLALAAPVWAAGRAVPLVGTHNTRDLGGLPTRGGTVRGHMVYRSGALCFIGSADVKTLQELHLHTIVDLRNPIEIQREGLDRAALLASVRRLSLPMSNSRGMGQEAYRYLLRENPGAIRTFFVTLADETSYPLLFHCSAGKDRTGILTALLLLSLGTPRDAITDDYLQSMRNSRGLEVHEQWLGEVYSAVDKAGGIEPYLAKDGVTHETLERVRAHLIAR